MVSNKENFPPNAVVGKNSDKRILDIPSKAVFLWNVGVARPHHHLKHHSMLFQSTSSSAVLSVELKTFTKATTHCIIRNCGPGNIGHHAQFTELVGCVRCSIEQLLQAIRSVQNNIGQYHERINNCQVSHKTEKEIRCIRKFYLGGLSGVKFVLCLVSWLVLIALMLNSKFYLYTLLINMGGL